MPQTKKLYSGDMILFYRTGRSTRPHVYIFIDIDIIQKIYKLQDLYYNALFTVLKLKSSKNMGLLKVTSHQSLTFCTDAISQYGNCVARQGGNGRKQII